MLEEGEFEKVYEFYEKARQIITNPVNMIIWVATPPKECFERAKERKNDCTLEQLELLDIIYTEWLENYEDVPVLKIEGKISDLENFAREFSYYARNLIKEDESTDNDSD